MVNNVLWNDTNIGTINPNQTTNTGRLLGITQWFPSISCNQHEVESPTPIGHLRRKGLGILLSILSWEKSYERFQL